MQIMSLTESAVFEYSFFRIDETCIEHSSLISMRYIDVFQSENAPNGLFGLHNITARGVFFPVFRNSKSLASKKSSVLGLAGSTSAGISTPTIEALQRAETSPSKPSLSMQVRSV